MAVRLNKRHSDLVRSKIQASQLINRLTDHALGEVELTQTQIRAIEILLNKSVPNLAAIAVQQMDGADESLNQITVKLVGESPRDSERLPEPLSTQSVQSVLGRQGRGEVMELRYRSTDPSDAEAVENSVYEGSPG